MEEGGREGEAGLKEPLRDSDFLERSPTLITTAIHKSVTTGGVGEQVQGHAAWPLSPRQYLCAREKPYALRPVIHKSVTRGGVGEQVQGQSAWRLSPRRYLCAREKPHALQPVIHKAVTTGGVVEQVQGHAAWRLSATVHISSAQDGISALGKSHMRSSPSLRSFPTVAQRGAGIAPWLERRTRD